MARAGKEPAEDVKRAFRRAIELTGLKAHRVEMIKSEGINRPNTFVARTVRGCSCQPRDLPATLKAVWAERQVIMDLEKRGELADSKFVGRWTWETPDFEV